MLPVSSEFVEICDAQVEILADGLGASLCIVYLTEPSSEQHPGALVPVVIYPEDLSAWTQSELLSWLEHVDGFRYPANSLPPLTQTPLIQNHPLADESRPDGIPSFPVDEGNGNWDSLNGTSDAENSAGGEQQGMGAIAPLLSDVPHPDQHKIALPLVYDGIVVGLLVTARPDRIWTDQEHHQIEQIAKTISIACVIDQRSQWLEAKLDHSHQKLLQAHQHDVFDDLIHQFRNPLTALRTFGKLLMRRLQPGDRNFGVAESIVRESDRLQDLLQQFKSALDLDQTEQQDGSAEHTPWLLSGTPSSDETPTDQVHRPDDRTRLSETASSAQGTHPVIDVSSSATYLTGHDISTMPCVLPEIIAPVLDVAEAIAQDHDVTLKVDLQPTLPPVVADATGLQEVLTNLLDNAIKYTPTGGQVLLRAPNLPTQQQAIIVADTGLGIPEDDQTHLFERHFRGVQATGTIPGTGLGLAIARDLLTQMGGEIEVFSPVTTAPLLTDWPPFPPQHPGTAFILWLNKAP